MYCVPWVLISVDREAHACEKSKIWIAGSFKNMYINSDFHASMHEYKEHRINGSSLALFRCNPVTAQLILFANFKICKSFCKGVKSFFPFLIWNYYFFKVYICKACSILFCIRDVFYAKFWTFGIHVQAWSVLLIERQAPEKCSTCLCLSENAKVWVFLA